MKKDWHGLKILVLCFVVFFSLAFAYIKIEKALGWDKPKVQPATIESMMGL